MRIDLVHLDAVPPLTLRFHPRLSVLHTDPATAQRLGEVLCGLALDPATGVEVIAQGPHARAVMRDVEVDRPRLVARRPQVDGGEPRPAPQVAQALADLHAAEARHEALLTRREAATAGTLRTRTDRAAALRPRLAGLLEEIAAALEAPEPVQDLALLERGTRLVDELARDELVSGPTLRSLLGAIDAASGLGPRTMADPDALELAVRWQQLDDEAMRLELRRTLAHEPVLLDAHRRVVAIEASGPGRSWGRRRWERDLAAARVQEAGALAGAGFTDWDDFRTWRAGVAVLPDPADGEDERAAQESIRLRRAGLRARIVSFLGHDPGDGVVTALRAKRRPVAVPYDALGELAAPDFDDVRAAEAAADAARRAVTRAFAAADRAAAGDAAGDAAVSPGGELSADAALPGADGVPLLLDGPTVVLDNRDLDAYLGSVLAAAETGQVILISSDARVASWARLLAPQVGALVEPVLGP